MARGGAETFGGTEATGRAQEARCTAAVCPQTHGVRDPGGRHADGVHRPLQCTHSLFLPIFPVQ